MCAVWFWRWCVQGQRRVLHSQGGGEDQGQWSCFLIQPQVQEVALPVLHHQAKAKGWPLRSPSVSCGGCSDSRGGLHDQGAACRPREGPDSSVMWSMMWCCVTFGLVCWTVGLLLVCWTESRWLWFVELNLVFMNLVMVGYVDASNLVAIYIFLSLNFPVVYLSVLNLWLVMFRCCELWS